MMYGPAFSARRARAGPNCSGRELEVMAEGVQKMSRWLKWIFTAGLGITVLSALPAAGAPAWQPTKPVEVVVPAGTGGGADLMARFVSAVLQKNNLAPQNFLVVNKAA